MGRGALVQQVGKEGSRAGQALQGWLGDFVVQSVRKQGGCLPPCSNEHTAHTAAGGQEGGRGGSRKVVCGYGWWVGVQMGRWMGWPWWVGGWGGWVGGRVGGHKGIRVHHVACGIGC